MHVSFFAFNVSETPWMCFQIKIMIPALNGSPRSNLKSLIKSINFRLNLTKTCSHKVMLLTQQLDISAGMLLATESLSSYYFPTKTEKNGHKKSTVRPGK